MSPSPVAPQIVGDVTFTKNTPEEGEATTVTCQWTGQPEPTVTWYKDGEELVEADFDHIRIVDLAMGRELQIEDMKLSDTGNYVCNVSNAAGFDYQTTRLEVQALSDDTCVYQKYNIIVRVCTYISLNSWSYHWTLHIWSICAGWVCGCGISSSSCIQGKTENLKW